MIKSTGKTGLWLCIAFLIFLSGNAVHGQNTGAGPSGNQPPAKPLLQDIKIHTGDSVPSASSGPLVKKTSSVEPVAVMRANSAYAVLADTPIPGYSGVLVETVDGKNVVEFGSAEAFNPASNVKIATAYAVLKTFGPEYRFPTNVWTDGTIDRATGILYGNLYVSGRDPIFAFEHGVAIANELNRLGVQTVNGDLIVTDNFVMNYSASAVRSGNSLFAVVDASKRSAAATRSWLTYLSNARRSNQISGIPSVKFTGAAYVQPIPSNLKLLFTHESAPMREIVKATLSYSNNFLAERLGDMLGGAFAVARVVHLNAGVPQAELSLQTSSGLGYNRVTPSAMMKLLRSFRSELARYRMSFADVMPVAGVDKGTLEGRFDTDFSKGSVVGKTGTLGNTDGGVSSLAGEMNTRNGKLLFVIFNQRGSVNRFRTFQNYYVSLIQGQFGGAAPFKYNPVAMDVRLARSRVTRPDTRAGNEE